MKGLSVVFISSLCFFQGRLASVERDNDSEGQTESRVGTNSLFKIVNGNNAPKGKYPWQVLIFFRYNFICGGTILDEKHVLTAAHCLYGAIKKKHYIVAVGVHLMFETVGTEQFYSVKRIQMHEEYSPYTNANDIAVLTLKQKIQYNDYIQPVTLADGSSVVNRGCYASGFGAVRQEPDMMASGLQEIRTRVVTKQRCKKIAQKYKVVDFITENVVCTKDKKAGVCSGDSGGPFGCFDSAGNYTQFGVLSFGSSNCRKGFNVYTRVSEYRDWISDQLN